MQVIHLTRTLSVPCFSLNLGSLISTFLTPIFREDVECFGDDTCYSLAFGVPAALMGIATVLLVLASFVAEVFAQQKQHIT